jgi:hypothetical protein
MDEKFYSKETMDAKLSLTNDKISAVHNLIVEFKNQYTKDTAMVKNKLDYTNGKVRKHQQILLVVGTATLVILVMGGSRFVELLKALFI